MRIWTTVAAGVLIVALVSDVAHAGETRPSPFDRSASTDRGADPLPPPVERYTMGQGVLLVERFGHAAICVRHRTRPADDVCYNYGTTDFAAPLALGWGFIRGEADFWVSTTSPSRMIRHYRRKDRTIWLQRLPLEPDQARAIAAALEIDARPENRYYQYHHFHDNCTTRVRDIIDEHTAGALSAGDEPGPGPTYRELSRRGLADVTPVVVASDFILGRAADRRPDMFEAMFLPRFLRSEVAERLGVEPVVLYQRRGPPFSDDPGGARWWFVILAIAVATPVIATRLLGRFRRAGLASAALLPSLLGLVLWLAAIVSPLPEVRFNEALFVFVPTDVALAFLGPRRRRRYARIRVAMLALVSALLAVGLFTQPLWLALLVPFGPLILAAAGGEDEVRPAPPDVPDERPEPSEEGAGPVPEGDAGRERPGSTVTGA